MFPLRLLGPPLADHRALRIQVPVLGAPAVRINTTNPQGRAQRFEFQHGPIRAAAKGIGHDPARLMIQRLLQPPRLFRAADKGPHFVYLRLLHLTDHHHGGCSLTTRHQGRVHLIERRRFFLRVLITVIGLDSEHASGIADAAAVECQVDHLVGQCQLKSNQM